MNFFKFVPESINCLRMMIMTDTIKRIGLRRTADDTGACPAEDRAAQQVCRSADNYILSDKYSIISSTLQSSMRQKSSIFIVLIPLPFCLCAIKK